MSDMFYNCSSLISLNLSNFNTNNVKENIFFGLNKNCDITTTKDNLLNLFTNL